MTTTDPLRIVRNPAPVRAQVLDSLRRAILDRRFPPGQRLIERELVELTGVSRTSIREALRELYQLRSALEGLAGRLFVNNATESQRKALVKALKAIEKAAKSGQSILKPKDQFYNVLFDGAGNESLRAMAGTLHARVAAMRSLSLSLPGRAATSVKELQAVVDAVLANDAEAAAQACSYHVEQAGRASLTALYAEQQLYSRPE